MYILHLLVYCIYILYVHTHVGLHTGECAHPKYPSNEGCLAGLLTVPNLFKHFSIYRLFSYSTHQLLIHLLIGEVGRVILCTACMASGVPRYVHTQEM